MAEIPHINPVYPSWRVRRPDRAVEKDHKDRQPAQDKTTQTDHDDPHENSGIDEYA